METYTLVRPEHLNHYGQLFGGQMLKWVDEFAWLVAAQEYPACRLVTRAMDRVEFKTAVDSGSILRFRVEPARVGQTSVAYRVRVYARKPHAVDDVHVFETQVTFVCVTDCGCKRTLPACRRDDRA